MLSCFPCCALYRWVRGDDDDPERQPLFPPPSTILTPPKRRPNLPNLSSSSLDRMANNPIWSSAPVSPAKSTGAFKTDLERVGSSSKLSEEGRERMGSISRAYGGRMQFLQPNTSTPSTPSIPSTPVGPGLGHLRPLSSLRPLATPSSTPTGHHEPVNAFDQDHSQPNQDRFGGGQVPPPYRPSVPNLGRSASEPRNLADLGGFAPHQVPFGALTVGRGRAMGRVSRGRNRSATINASQRFSSLSVDISSEGKGRGRSPGPALMSPALIKDDSAGGTAGEADRGAKRGTEIGPSMGRSMSHPTLYSGVAINNDANGEPRSETASEISINHQGAGRSACAGAGADAGQGECMKDEDDLSGSIVVKRELGLRGLGGLSGRGRGGKRRTKSRGSASGSRSGSGSGSRRGSGSGSGSGRGRMIRPVGQSGKRVISE
ncbi:hypothetical protein IAT40_000735 [Kwoniella sp. CBS 6097]